MDQTQMKERCPSARLLGVAILKDYELAFTIYSPKRECGCADVVSQAGAEVYGLLYELTDAAMRQMDIFEGHPEHYHRITVPVFLNDAVYSAETYEVVKKTPGQIPSKHYLGLLIGAAAEFNFLDSYQVFLRSFVTIDK